jgi:anti-anti-sigma factor
VIDRSGAAMMTLTTRQAAEFRVSLWRGQVTSLRLEGELDLAGTGVLARAARHVPAHAAIVTVDLGSLTFIDGTGAGALSDFHASQVARGREVRLVHAHPAVTRVLGILGMGHLLTAPAPGRRPPLRLVPSERGADLQPAECWPVDRRGVVEVHPVVELRSV